MSRPNDPADTGPQEYEREQEPTQRDGPEQGGTEHDSVPSSLPLLENTATEPETGYPNEGSAHPPTSAEDAGGLPGTEPGTEQDDPNATMPFDPLETTAFDSDATGVPLGSTSPGSGSASSAADFAMPKAGAVLTAVSHFRVEGRFNHGNLGVLFRARNLELNREVALKEIKPDNAHNPDTRAEFVLEAEITGGLEHPNIVPIHDLGRHDDGRPFYAMRLIRGETLRDAINRLYSPESGPNQREPNAAPRAETETGADETFRNLLLRFLGVCQALAYAHSRGIIHRDLKPSNIMLGPYGETQVIDFGLAKPVAGPEVSGHVARPLVSSDESALGSTREAPLRPSPEARAALTVRSGTRKGTPAYMSPEQAEGEEVGFASDVYNLGATFYCLITGKNPVPGESPTAVLNRVRRGDFPRPREVRPEVHPALEAVCLKAMAFRPEDRYQSPLDFARDITRWLADEPVSAWKEPRMVRLARWERKHRKLIRVGGAALAAIAIIATGAAVLVEGARRDTDKERQLNLALYQKAEAERQIAEAEREKAKAAQAEAERNFLTSLDIADRFVSILDEDLVMMSLSESLRKELADRCLEDYRSFVQYRPDDPALIRKTADVVRKAANIHRLLEEKEPSPGVLYQESLGLLDRLEVLQGATADSQLRRVLLTADEGAWNGMEGRSLEGEHDYTRGVELARECLSREPNSPGLKFSLAVSLWSLAGARARLGRFDEARDLSQEALDIIGPMADKPRASWVRKLIRARIGLQQISIDRQAGDPEAAERRLEHVAASVDALEASDPLQPDVQATVAKLQMERTQLAIEFPDRPRAAEIEEHCLRALILLNQLYRQHTAIPNRSRELAEGLNNRAGLYRTAAEPQLDRAEKDASDALRVIDSLFDRHKRADNLRPADHESRGDTLAELARIARLKKDDKLAADRFDQAAAEYEAALAIDPDRWSIRRSLERLKNDRAAAFGNDLARPRR